MDNLLIPGQGWVLTGNVDAAVPDITTFDETDIDNFSEAWDWIGSTSLDSIVSISKEGGEVESKGTWDTPNKRTTKNPETWTMTISAVSFTQATLEKAFPTGTWDAQAQGYALPSKSSTTSRAVLVIMRDAVSGYAAIYVPNGAMSAGDAPTLDAENFFEIPLSVVAQTSPTTKSPLTFFPPRLASN